jgi:nitrogen fixation/metabolism regulation signal transduction histidine kinase
MGFNDFRLKVLLRIVLLVIVISLGLFFYMSKNSVFIPIVMTIVVIIQIFELSNFVTQTNRKLTKFLESIKYSDFVTGFSSGNKLGKSFRDLNQAFNEVIDAIRKARSDKEEHWQFLNTIVEHVSVGVVSFDSDGNVGLMNAAAKKLIGLDRVRNIEELIEENSKIYKALFDLPAGKSTLFRTKKDIQISLHATEIKLAETNYKLVALQNIQPELQKKELEAWQNLTKILRHEIMNSIAPIASLTSTLKDIIVEDIRQTDNSFELDSETIEDLEEGLITIEDRSKGLIKFINAYRDYTTIPPPDVKSTSVKDLLERVLNLMKGELQNAGIANILEVHPVDLIIKMDEEQVEQVIINMARNSIQALEAKKRPLLKFYSGYDDENNPVIIIEDNGKGIIREALDKIFIPFYTTKAEGSGIGLALSRQIMQHHHGSISVDSEPEKYTRFTLRF